MRREHIILGLLLGATLFAHLITATHYPMFRDELYYLDCADHLDWGYVDQPPLSIAVLAGWRAIAGDSPFAVRFLPALAAALLIWLIWKLTAELGGGLFAKILATVASIFSTQQRAIMGFYSMNAVDLLFWTAALWILARILNTDDSRGWIPFGVVVGFGLMNKVSLLFLGAGLVAAMLVTRFRRHFARPQFWIGGLIAAVIFLPYVLWQFTHEFATLEFMRNATVYKNVAFAPHQFLAMVMLENNPLTVIVWGMGLVALLFCPVLRAFRALGWLALTVFIILMAQNGKPYYSAGLMPLLFAAGARALEFRLPAPRWTWARAVVIVLIVLSGLALLPFGLRVLSPDQFIAYQTALGVAPPASERGHVGSPMPQIYSDSFGWEEMTAAVAGVYHALPPEQQRDCVIVSRNYGEAGAINYYGRKLNLPHGYSVHNNHYFWGPPAATPETTYIVLGREGDGPQEAFDSVTVAAVHRHPLAMPEENDLLIFIARSPKAPLAELWRQGKTFV